MLKVKCITCMPTMSQNRVNLLQIILISVWYVIFFIVGHENLYFHQCKSYKTYTVIKVAIKPLWSNQSLGVNFTNVFMRSFYTHRFQMHKMTDDLTVFFTLLGSGLIKIVRKTFMKLTLPRWQLKTIETVCLSFWLATRMIWMTNFSLTIPVRKDYNS